MKTDERGLIPESLEMVLSQWPKPVDAKPSLGKLKALYVVPNGGNPSGTRYSLDRKRLIYKMAQEYNFLIIEDDAYYFLEERVGFVCLNEPPHDKTNKMACTPSLIRVLAVRLKKDWVLYYPVRAQRGL